MKKILIILTLTQLLLSDAFLLTATETQFQMVTEFSDALQHIINTLNIDEIKNHILLLEAFLKMKHQEEEKFIQELIVKKNMEEMKKQRIIQTYLEGRAGATSVLRDFFSNRL